MNITPETHSQVTFWIRNADIQKFDRIAENEQVSRSALLRTCINECIRKAEGV